MSSGSVQFYHVFADSYWKTIQDLHSSLQLHQKVSLFQAPQPQRVRGTLFSEGCLLGAAAERCSAARVPPGWTGQPTQRHTPDAGCQISLKDGVVQIGARWG